MFSNNINPLNSGKSSNHLSVFIESTESTESTKSTEFIIGCSELYSPKQSPTKISPNQLSYKVSPLTKPPKSWFF